MRILVIATIVFATCAAVLAVSVFLLRSELRNGIDAMIPWVACADGRDRDRSIRACTIVIDRGDRENLVDRVAAFYNRGVAFDAKNEPDRALADYDAAIKLDPKEASAYDNRGTIYHSRGDLRRAIADYDQAIRLDPNDAVALNNRAQAYVDWGDATRALVDYDRAIALKPRFAMARLGRGRLHESRGELDAAIADFTAFRDLRPGDPRGPKAEAEVRAKLKRKAPVPAQ